MRNRVSSAEDRELRAVLYHSAAELVTDWPAIFARQGFRILECRDIISETLPTWERVRAVYRRRDGEVSAATAGGLRTERSPISSGSAASSQRTGPSPCSPRRSPGRADRGN